MKRIQKVSALRVATSAVLVAAAVLAGCGGGGGGSSPDPVVTVGQSVMKTIEFVSDLIAGSTSENSAPIDTNALTLATDETSEPAAIN